ncbi:cytochrome oxidase subunit III [Blastopirellula marina]|uniref:Cytochrome oxidase subunit III n=1 Tax=Blastopirellula marina TaxID=124 RepID=A0A2S8EZ87_9BACT|nr:MULTISPECIES: cytochrome c oxidase subunit 3 family protein [Pirellulaceae]PQO25235.1 cytochrome oxidase subunit III [Blastopirellula marina]RCS41668.1 cytochrome c oxidase subunit 3 family protein [Bremerella cremea]
MSAAVDTQDQAHHEDGDHHGHSPFQAHHFETMQQQFDAGKLGIWLFLFTEILMFSGLFCAYLIYRYNHPEVFLYAHKYLNTNLGALNTVVLIVSSLTMAWAVRAAQLSQKKLLVVMLSITLALAGVFLVVKYFEYTHKFEMGLVTGRSNVMYQLQHPDESDHNKELYESAIAAEKKEAAKHKEEEAHAVAEAEHEDEHPHEHADTHASEHGDSHGDGHGGPEQFLDAPRNTQIFFGIYYMMTGLHGFHILFGMVAIGWLLYRSIRGDFSSEYFGPVDYVGLYWHLVDLIWIYLFPLLYLIRS